MHRQPVSSSNLRSVGYDPATQTLEVEFRDGSVYHGLMAAGSKEGYQADHVKGVYRHHHVG